MMSFKGIWRYLIYACVIGWMFFLGILVGRGTSPVTFDTKKVFSRLEEIVSDAGPEKEADKKIDLNFYAVLDNPLAEDALVVKSSPLAAVPVKEAEKSQTLKQSPIKTVQETVQEVVAEKAAVAVHPKTSRKKLTAVTVAVITKTEGVPEKPPAPVETKSERISDLKPEPARDLEPASPKEQDDEPAMEKKAVKGLYTIQIAAYKNFKDAVSQMAELKNKKISSYRVRGDKDGITWYRVRTGNFETYEDAGKFKIILDKAGIDSIIMKRESDEDIK